MFKLISLLRLLYALVVIKLESTLVDNSTFLLASRIDAAELAACIYFKQKPRNYYRNSHVVQARTLTVYRITIISSV